MPTIPIKPPKSKTGTGKKALPGELTKANPLKAKIKARKKDPNSSGGIMGW